MSLNFGEDPGPRFYKIVLKKSVATALIKVIIISKVLLDHYASKKYHIPLTEQEQKNNRIKCVRVNRSDSKVTLMSLR